MKKPPFKMGGNQANFGKFGILLKPRFWGRRGDFSDSKEFSTAEKEGEFSTVPTAFSTEMLDLLAFFDLPGAVLGEENALAWKSAELFHSLWKALWKGFFQGVENWSSFKVLNLGISAEICEKPLDSARGFTQLNYASSLSRRPRH